MHYGLRKILRCTASKITLLLLSELREWVLSYVEVWYSGMM
jgi:hypothetical protein